ncbi:ATP-binding cassette domain-containing protein [Aquibacillus halophilus]|uniref:ATP-binding cassette domain-containing protein n=1 Tax=Aquibacillus halophilus TaxID=930132 RepID=A0A6A8D8V7_9BACI|nr:ATP-binding cassette domain-containing protein [Aquibacillus halophilus]MRH42028.1 ATP-binding cassette domain-containing protein [Aquibacillus halophilus]
MITFENISKVYGTKKQPITALDDVSLTVKKGTIFGVIGYSGAGKSTLVRIANLLERPSDGKVFIDDVDLTTLSKTKLRQKRNNIGMIFQSFNLLQTGTVYENIALPLKLTGIPKKEIKERVKKYINVVGLEDKLHAYPSQLSGGQKQRVAIARALAHEPSVLLCDEATSALDPDTTDSILNLLEQINNDFGITILLITHEMHVVQKICHEVAVMEQGKVIEQGSILNIFTEPKTETTKRFVHSLFNEQVPESILKDLKLDGKVITMSYVGDASGDPALALVSKKFDVYPSILSGRITQLKGEPYGRLVVHLKGSDEEVELSINYLKEKGILVKGYNNEVDINAS